MTASLLPGSQAGAHRLARGGDGTRFILVGASHPGNVGATARAMKTMGFADLVLVAPRYADVLRHDEARSLASGATDVLDAARVVDDLAGALDGITFACATAMTPRDFGPPTHAPRELFASLAAGPERVAFVFGSERFGMANDDVYRCHAAVSIPTDPGCGSLNLAQAVQLIAYDWRQALGGFTPGPRPEHPARADAAAVQGVLAHWDAALQAIGFLDARAPRKLMPRLNRLLNRAALLHEEVHILRGIAKAMLETAAGRGRDRAGTKGRVADGLDGPDGPARTAGNTGDGTAIDPDGAAPRASATDTPPPRR